MRGDSLQHSGHFLCAWLTQQAQVFLGEDGAQAGRDRGVARNLQRATVVDGTPKITEKGNASRASFDVPSHFFASEGLNSTIQVLREVGKQLAALGWALSAFASATLRPLLDRLAAIRLLRCAI
jgi:hypothetical protein